MPLSPDHTEETAQPDLPRPLAEPDWRERLTDLIERSHDWRTHLLRAPVVLGVGLTIVTLGAVAMLVLRQPAQAQPVDLLIPTANPADAPIPTPTPALFVVHVSGAVDAPGVYTVHQGARVADVVALAGGAGANADLERTNLAAPVTDGQRLFVPRLGEPVPPVVAGTAPAVDGTPAGPVDLNTATVAELEGLPGVGPATASAIVAYRDEHGGFSSISELLEVPGIGPAKLSLVEDLVVVQ